MFETTRHHTRAAVLAAALLAAPGAAAQAPAASAAPAIAVSPTVLEAHLVRTGLYEITGGGGNTLVRLSAVGSVVVGSKASGDYRPLMTQIRRISRLSDLPVRVLVLTDHHDANAGNAAQFAAAGVALLVQQNALRRLPSPPAAATKAPAPTVPFDRDYRLQIGGVEVNLHHFGNAVTDGDTVVHFPDLKVVAVGDLYTSGAPTPDLAAGGSLVQWASVLAQVLQLDFAVAVPASGPNVTRAEVAAFHDKLATLVARAGELVRRGVPKSALPAELRTEDLGWRLAFTPDELDHLYADLANGN